VNGSVTLDGAMLSATSTYSYPPTFAMVLIANDSRDRVLGTFGGPKAIKVNGQGFDIYYNGGDGNDVVLRRVASSAMVFGIR